MAERYSISCQNVRKYQIGAEHAGVRMQYKSVACSFFCNSDKKGKELKNT